MNERILELAGQAGMGHERWNTTVQFESFLEKFAVLIVRECTTVVASVPPCHGDYRDQIEVGMRDHCARVILDHFELK